MPGIFEPLMGAGSDDNQFGTQNAWASGELQVVMPNGVIADGHGLGGNAGRYVRPDGQVAQVALAPEATLGGGRCGFVWGQRGREQVAVCDVEGAADVRGLGTAQPVLEEQLRAVQFPCPVCETPLRLDPRKAPCAVEERELMFDSGKGPIRLRPLTVYIPVKCAAPVAALSDEGTVLGTGICDWEAIIRRGRAYPMDYVRGILPQAVAAAGRAWQHACAAVDDAGRRSGKDFTQWRQALDRLWQQATPSMQRIQTGRYERSGPCSLVGAWEVVDHTIQQSGAMVRQLTGGQVR